VDGALKAGATLTVTLNLNEAVTVAGGEPTLTLSNHGLAAYDAVDSTSTALVFKYTVGSEGDTSALAVGSVNLGGATIEDASNVNLDLSGALAPLGVAVDTVAPHLTGIAQTDATTTKAGTVHYTVSFSEAVSGVTAADFSLATSGVSGASITGVNPVDGSNGAQYVVTVDTGARDGTIALQLNEGPIADLAGNLVPGPNALADTSAQNLGRMPGAIVDPDRRSQPVPDLPRHLRQQHPGLSRQRHVRVHRLRDRRGIVAEAVLRSATFRVTASSTSLSPTPAPTLFRFFSAKAMARCSRRRPLRPAASRCRSPSRM